MCPSVRLKNIDEIQNLDPGSCQNCDFSMIKNVKNCLIAGIHYMGKNVILDLGPNCLQRLSAYSKSDARKELTENYSLIQLCPEVELLLQQRLN